MGKILVFCSVFPLTSDGVTSDLYLLLTRHEHEYVSSRWLEVDLHCLFHAALHIVFAGITTVEDVHWERSSRDLRGNRGGEGREVGKEKKEGEEGVKGERSVKHVDEGGEKEGKEGRREE